MCRAGGVRKGIKKELNQILDTLQFVRDLLVVGGKPHTFGD